MAWSQVDSAFLQYSADASGNAASGYFIKAYAAGTSTPISLSYDSSGSSLTAKAELDSLGYVQNGSGGSTLLYIDQKHRLVLYLNTTDADNNTFANAVQDIDDIDQVASLPSVLDEVRRSGEFNKNFDILLDAVASSTIVEGDVLNIKERISGNQGQGTWDVVLASSVTTNTYDIVQCTGVPTLALVLRITEPADPKAFGAYGTSDDTDGIQLLMDKSTYIEFGAGVYNVRAQPEADYLTPQENTTLVFEQGASIKSIGNSANVNVLLNLTQNNINVWGGVYDGNRSAHTGGPDKHHGIRVEGNISGVKLFGTHVVGCLGDGYKVQDAGSPTGSADSPFGLEFTSISSDDCGRQGIAVTGCKGLNINGAYFANTNGNNPESGIDLEPNENNVVQNINLSNCTTEGNSGGGLVIGNNNVSEVNVVNFISLNDGEQGINVSRDADNISIQGFIVKNSVLQGVRITNDDPTKSCRNISISEGRIIDSQSTGITVQNVGGDVVGIRLSNIDIIDNMAGDGCAISGALDVQLNQINVKNAASNGISIISSPKAQVNDCDVILASSRGYAITTSNRSRIDNCYSDQAGLEGMRIANSTECSVTGGEYRSSSQTTNIDKSNIQLDGDCSLTMLNAVRCTRDTALTNQPNYAIEIDDATTTNAQIRNCPLIDGGATGAIDDNGTTTQLSDNLT